jgi:hypothetical protein
VRPLHVVLPLGLAAVFAAYLVWLGRAFLVDAIPAYPVRRTEPASRERVEVTVTPWRLPAREGAPRPPDGMALEVRIRNETGADVHLLDDPSLPGLEASASSLTLHYDVEDFPDGADANVNVFRVPARTIVRSGGTATRRVEVTSPVALSNWVGLHWDTSSRPPTRLRAAPSVALGPHVTVKVVVGYGTTPFEYTTRTVPQDQRLAFLAWQRRANSTPITIVR